MNIGTNDEYLRFMYESLIILRELLSDNGSIYLHCDWHKSHYLRAVLDEIFGRENFKNEIVWYYRRWNIESTRYAANHDTLLFYNRAKSAILFYTEVFFISNLLSFGAYVCIIQEARFIFLLHHLFTSESTLSP